MKVLEESPVVLDAPATSLVVDAQAGSVSAFEKL